jgi:hypothetical protein
MEMLRHHHIANHEELIFLPDLFKDIQEQVSAGRGTEKRFSLVTTAGNVMDVSISIPPV